MRRGRGGRGGGEEKIGGGRGGRRGGGGGEGARGEGKEEGGGGDARYNKAILVCLLFTSQLCSQYYYLRHKTKQEIRFDKLLSPSLTSDLIVRHQKKL